MLRSTVPDVTGLLDQSQMSVECLCLSESEGWVSKTYETGDKVYFDSIDFRCDIAAIYRKVPGVGKGDA
jgi:hypothetical protein